MLKCSELCKLRQIDPKSDSKIQNGLTETNQVTNAQMHIAQNAQMLKMSNAQTLKIHPKSDSKMQNGLTDKLDKPEQA